MPSQKEQEIGIAKTLVKGLRERWTRKTSKPKDENVDVIINDIIVQMMSLGYPKWAKDIQGINTPAHANVLIEHEDELSHYWIGVIKGMRYVDVTPPNRNFDSPDQNPFQFLNWSGQNSAFRFRIQKFRKHIMQRCSECGHISPYYYPRIGRGNSPDYLLDEEGNKQRDDDGKFIVQNDRYTDLLVQWKRAEVKNICPKCWDNGRGMIVPCPDTWMNEVYQSASAEEDGYDFINNLSVEPNIEEQLIFENIVDRFVQDRWVKLGSREHELLTILFRCPDIEIGNYYEPKDNDPPFPATKVLDDPIYGPVAVICMMCNEDCKNGIIGHGKCRNYQAKLAGYYGTTQTCVNQYRKRLIDKLQRFCSVHKITFMLPE